MTNLNDIEVKFASPEGGEYGIHDGFFNGIAILADGREHHFQCCAEPDLTIDFNDCGYDWGICGDANKELAEKIGWENMLPLLEKAYKLYLKEETNNETL